MTFILSAPVLGRFLWVEMCWWLIIFCVYHFNFGGSYE